MSTPIKLRDLLEAFEWVDAGEVAGIDSQAYVNRLTGAVHFSGELMEEELPADIEDESLYLEVPGKQELDLGRNLALRFTREQLPDSFDVVADFFRKKGAYSRFKSLLERTGRLDAWYRYEEQATEQALREWAEVNGLTLVR
jgi:hypothetical protein